MVPVISLPAAVSAPASARPLLRRLTYRQCAFGTADDKTERLSQGLTVLCREVLLADYHGESKAVVSQVVK